MSKHTTALLVAVATSFAGGILHAEEETTPIFEVVSLHAYASGAGIAGDFDLGTADFWSHSSANPSATSFEELPDSFTETAVTALGASAHGSIAINGEVDGNRISLHLYGHAAVDGGDAGERAQVWVQPYTVLTIDVTEAAILQCQFSTLSDAEESIVSLKIKRVVDGGYEELYDHYENSENETNIQNFELTVEPGTYVCHYYGVANAQNVFRDWPESTTVAFTHMTIVPSTPDPILGDINGDDKVDGQDLALLLGAWGTSDSSSDLNGDGTVDGQDLAILLGNWTD